MVAGAAGTIGAPTAGIPGCADGTGATGMLTRGGPADDVPENDVQPANPPAAIPRASRPISSGPPTNSSAHAHSRRRVLVTTGRGAVSPVRAAVSTTRTIVGAATRMRNRDDARVTASCGAELVRFHY